VSATFFAPMGGPFLSGLECILKVADLVNVVRLGNHGGPFSPLKV